MKSSDFTQVGTDWHPAAEQLFLQTAGSSGCHDAVFLPANSSSMCADAFRQWRSGAGRKGGGQIHPSPPMEGIHPSPPLEPPLDLVVIDASSWGGGREDLGEDREDLGVDRQDLGGALREWSALLGVAVHSFSGPDREG
ncbi:hypothetical protein T484DRAFT_1922514, partial [Baffinella frigidus]